MMIKKIKQIWFKYKYAKASPTDRANMMREKLYHVGNNVELYTSNFGTEPYLISIHDNVTVAAHVSFINHDVSCFNIARVLGVSRNEVDKVNSIVLHENCFIGAFSILMPGASVGKNSVIAAGSVVSGIIPDGEVWGGVPAKYIMKTKEYADKVLKRSQEFPWMSPRLKGRELIKSRQQFLFDQEDKKRKTFNK